MGQQQCHSAAKSVKLGQTVIASARCGLQLGFSTDRRILRFSSAAWMRIILALKLKTADARLQAPLVGCTFLKRGARQNDVSTTSSMCSTKSWTIWMAFRPLKRRGYPASPRMITPKHYDRAND